MARMLNLSMVGVVGPDDGWNIDSILLLVFGFMFICVIVSLVILCWNRWYSRKELDQDHQEENPSYNTFGNYGSGKKKSKSTGTTSSSSAINYLAFFAAVASPAGWGYGGGDGHHHHHHHGHHHHNPAGHHHHHSHHHHNPGHHHGHHHHGV